MDTVHELFEEQIKDLYSAEKQLIKALPKMARKVSSPTLKKAMEQHLVETEEQVKRLEQIAEQLDFKPTGKTCAGMKGLLEEGAEAASEEGEEPVVDAGIIAAAQRVEHYEIAGYGTVLAMAKLMGHTKAVKLIEKTLQEEGRTDKLLTQIAETELYPAAALHAEPA